MLPQNTIQAYQQILASCQDLFHQKHQDYGSSWRIMRLSSFTDQIFIKAKRIRSIQEKGVQKVPEGVQGEFIGIINYCLQALVQLDLQSQAETSLNISWKKLEPLLNTRIEGNKALLLNKNHDYGEAWRDMRVSSMTDLILMKLFRIKQIEDNQGYTKVSEGVESIYQDILNYSVFCLIKLEEAQHEDN